MTEDKAIAALMTLQRKSCPIELQTTAQVFYLESEKTSYLRIYPQTAVLD